MLKKDLTIRVEYDPADGGWIFKQQARYRIISPRANGYVLYATLTLAQYEKSFRQQKTKPALLTVVGNDNRHLWWFKNVFYWDKEGRTASDIEVLLLDRLYKEKRKLERAK